MEDRLKEIEAQLEHDGPEGADIHWLITEVKHLRNARIKDHEYYIGACKHVAKTTDPAAPATFPCAKIELIITRYLRGLKIAYCGELYSLPIVDDGDRRP